MAPQPNKDSKEVDMERKEELILAKQLRACRVSILPKSSLQDFGFNPPSPQRAPQKVPIKITQKNNLQVPAPKKEHVEKASSPIALRYWNQCLNTGDTKTNIEDAFPTEKKYGDYLDLPWLSKDESSPSPSPNPSPQLIQHHMKPKISVPDIRRHMQEVQSNTNWEEILQEEDRRKTSLQQPAFYKYKEITKFKSVERHSHSDIRNITSSNQQQVVISTNMVKTDLPKVEEPRPINKPKPEPLKFLQAPVRSRAHDDPSPVMDSPGSSPRFTRTPSKHPENHNSPTERVPVEYERILSTAGQGIKRENEKKEAKMNINRFITMGKIKSLDETSPPVMSNSHPTFNSNQPSSSSPKTPQNVMYTPNTARKLGLTIPNPSTQHQSLLSEKEFLEKQTFSTIDSDKAKVSKLNKQESCSSNFSSSDSDSELYPHKTNSTVNTNNVNKAGQDAQTTTAVTDLESVNLEKVVLSYFQKTDPKDIGEIIVKKLDEKRKNALGLVFYKEISSGLLKEIIAQEIMNQTTEELVYLLMNLPTEVSELLVPRLAAKVNLSQTNQTIQTPAHNNNTDFASLSKSFRELNKTDQRRLLEELNGEHVENTCIPDIVVSPEEAEEWGEERSMSETYLSTSSDSPGEKKSKTRDMNEREIQEKSETKAEEKEEKEEEEEMWEEGEEWEEEEDEYTVETFDGSFSIAL